jgi:acyl-coenzyme A synthetase/AMP-(fatty) acid ligase
VLDADLLLLLQLGLMRLGAAPMPPTLPARHASRCLTDAERDPGMHSRTQRVAASMFDTPGAAFPGYDDPDAIAIVCPSSGTNGIAKSMAITHAMLDARIAIADAGVPMPDAPRQVLLGSATGYGILTALRVLGAGGALVLAPSPDEIPETIERQRVDRIALMPWSLQRMVAARPAGIGPLASLRQLEVGGERLPEPLWRLARERICAEIWSVYGATECGTIAVGAMETVDFSRGELGRVLPGVTIAAFDDDGARLPDGAQGSLRMRGAGCVTGYLGDDAISAATFRDGWFVTGDLGSVEAGRVMMSGRAADLVNLGGIKLALATIEDVARSVEAVGDVAAFGAPSANGIAHIALAVVPRARLDVAAIRAAFAAKLPGFAPSLILAVDALPRGVGGKVRRDVLASMAAKQGFGPPVS